MAISLDRPMRPEEMDWMTRFRADVNRQLAKARQMQFDRRVTRQSADTLGKLKSYSQALDGLLAVLTLRSIQRRLDRCCHR